MSENPCCSNLGDLFAPQLFRAIADPTRVGLLTSLGEAGGPRTVSELAEGADVDISVVSRHLAILRDAEILHAEKRGRTVYYSIRRDILVRALRDLADGIEACCAATQAVGA